MSAKQLFCLILLLTAFIGLRADRNAYQKIMLDDYYSHLIKKDAKDKTVHYYNVKAAGGIILDCSKYDFSQIRKMNKGKDPDKIHLICKSGTFDIDLNVSGETVIDKSTMHSIGETKPFYGFQQKDTAILAIGTIAIKEKNAEMLTYWISMIAIE